MSSPEQDLLDLLSRATAKKPTASTEGSIAEEEVKKGNPDATKPVTLRTLFSHHEAHPVVLSYSCLKAFGPDWIEWDGDTLFFEINETFKTDISKVNKSKVRAAQICYRRLMPWEKWQVFEKVSASFNGRIADFYAMQIPTIEELYATVDVMRTLRPDVQWSDEVKLYMAGAVLHEDVFYVPAPLDFIQVEVTQPHYKCADCGNQEPALFHDGVCSNCTNRMGPMQGLTLEPERAKVLAGKGKNVELTLRYDPSSVANRYDEVRALASSEVKLDPQSGTDVQVGKLLLARDYMNIRRRQLNEQLTTLKAWLGAA